MSQEQPQRPRRPYRKFDKPASAKFIIAFCCLLSFYYGSWLIRYTFFPTLTLSGWPARVYLDSQFWLIVMSIFTTPFVISVALYPFLSWVWDDLQEHYVKLNHEATARALSEKDKVQ